MSSAKAVNVALPVDVWLDLWSLKRRDEKAPADVVRRLIREQQAACVHPTRTADAGGHQRCASCAKPMP